MVEFELLGIPTAFIDIFNQIYEILTSNLSWMIISFVFAMMILAVHLISLLSINYAKEVALGVGAAIGLICMLMIAIVAEINISILSVLVGSIISFGLIAVVKFFDKVMDYKRTERVRFEDDDYMYYVKMIPKVKKAEAVEVYEKREESGVDEDEDSNLYRPPVRPSRPNIPPNMPPR